MVRSHPFKKTNPDLRRQTQMPAPAIETFEAELRRYLEPEHFKPIQSYHQIPEKLRRDRLLTLPQVVALVLGLVYRKLPSFSRSQIMTFPRNRYTRSPKSPLKRGD
jgi:hypothetical protein